MDSAERFKDDKVSEKFVARDGKMRSDVFSAEADIALATAHLGGFEYVVPLGTVCKEYWQYVEEMSSESLLAERVGADSFRDITEVTFCSIATEFEIAEALLLRSVY